MTRKNVLVAMLLFVAGGLTITTAGWGQNPSPQPNFATQLLSASPSVYLNFNDLTTSFKDQVSGSTFSGQLINLPPSGYVGRWQLNEGSGSSALDSSGNANTGTWKGAASCSSTYYTNATNQGAYAGCFNGTNNYIDLGATSQLNFSNVQPFTIAIWMKASSFASESTLFGNMTSSGTYQGWSLDFGNGATQGVEFYFINSYTSGNFIQVNVSKTLDDGNWHLIAVTSSGSGTAAGITLYVDGVAQTSTVVKDALTGTTANSGTHQTIGSRAAGSAPFTGSLNNAMAYNSALSATQIAQMYRMGQWTSGTVVTRQPGFDSTAVNNTSAAFPYNGFNFAPNNTLGAIDWYSPWSMLFHLDRLNWNRMGTLVLASKGDISSLTNSYWELYLTMNGNFSELCFLENGPNSAGAPFPRANQSVCTKVTFDTLPNGFNYDIIVTNNGSGWNSGLSLYVNGLNGSYISETPATGSYQYGFGTVGVTVSGGTGYAATTAFTASGGGPYCVVSGSFASSSGVPTGAVTYTQSSGCTSVPTISLTAATGSGATITPTLYTASMNATNYPLMVPGYVSAGAYNGIDSADSTQSSTNVDEFAIFPAVLNQTQIQSLFYQTKFWQGVVKAMPSTPYTLILSEDGCEDTDNLDALSLAIAAQQIGYIRLAGVEDTTGGTSTALYRQMLDEAGLSQIPVSVPSILSGSNIAACNAANLNIYNATTPQVASAYESSATMYRRVFAANPSTPVFIMMGGSSQGVADWMGSPADSISALTGAQMVARNATNGGAIYAQGLGANISFSSDNTLEEWQAAQYTVTHNGSMPMYWYGGIPQSAGPGVLSTRTSKDPRFLEATTYGTDVRQAYDSLPTQSFLSTLFSGGVQIAISGSGTGYAASTPFTSTGGGANCVVTGFMLSTGGVPSSIISTGGVTSNGANNYSYTGLGSGCFNAASPPTIVLTAPTGTGAVLTATTTASPCGTVTITSATAGSTSTATCSNHYFLPYSLNADQTPVQGAVMQWFLNSLIDPMPGGAARGR